MDRKYKFSWDLIGDSSPPASRIRAIVSQMRVFADTERTPFEICEVHRVMHKALEDLAREMPPGITITPVYEPIGGVRCKPDELRLVFLHLLRNAIPSIAREGEVRVHVGALNDQALVGIDDTGCGIPEEQLGRTFNPFFTTSRLVAAWAWGCSSWQPS